MSQIRLTTTGTIPTVLIDGLGGVTFTHPTNQFIMYDSDLGEDNEFELDLIKNSDDLQSAIDAGYIILDDEDSNVITNVFQTILDYLNIKVKEAYESNLDTNVFSDADKTKLDNIGALIPPSYIVTSTSTTTRSSSTVALLSGMTITPISGTYVVFFSTDGALATKGKKLLYQIYVGGVAVSESYREIQQPRNSTSGGNTMHTQTKVTVNGSQAIEIRWASKDGSTVASIHERSLILIQVA